MGFRAGSYAKIWNIEKGNGNYYVAEMSTSKKMKDRDGNDILENGKAKYETDWSNKFVRLVGTAAKQAESLKPNDSVKIESCDVTNKYDKEKKTTYTNYVIFAFSENDASKNSGTNNKDDNARSSDSFVNIPDNSAGEMPF